MYEPEARNLLFSPPTCSRPPSVLHPFNQQMPLAYTVLKINEPSKQLPKIMVSPLLIPSKHTYVINVPN